uniref:Putative secreted protein n=1 Tax=Anopheles triannulatus TaxID=58253 RepID=A0A2M4B7W6_9DIPT
MRWLLCSTFLISERSSWALLRTSETVCSRLSICFGVVSLLCSHSCTPLGCSSIIQSLHTGMLHVRQKNLSSSLGCRLQK